MAVIEPDDLANLGLWLKSDTGLYTDAGVTPVSSDGDAVYQWNDQSGNARHYSQATSGNRPLYKTGRVNGLPAVLFDASDDYMTSGWGPSHPYTVILVSARRANTGMRILNGTNNWLVGIFDSGGTYWDGFYNGQWTSQTAVQSTINAFTMKVARAGASGTDNGSSFLVNRKEYVQDGSSGPTAPGQLIVGGGGGGATNNPSNADIAEVIVYERCLTRKEINQLEDYVADRYALFNPYRLVNGVIGCCQYFQANAGVTLTSGKVSQWDDQSGFDDHMTQTNAAWRPSIASADLNSTDTMTFSGSPIFLFLASAMRGSGAWHEAEIHSLIKADADPNSGAKTGLWELGNVASSTHYPFTDGVVYDSAARNTRHTTGNPTLSLASDYRLYSLSSANSVGGTGLYGTDGKYTTWFDRTLHYQSSVDGGFVAWNPTNAIGIGVAGDEFWGKFASFAVFNRQLDSTERGLVWDVMEKSAYPASLPFPEEGGGGGSGARSFCAGLIG